MKKKEQKPEHKLDVGIGETLTHEGGSDLLPLRDDSRKKVHFRQPKRYMKWSRFWNSQKNKELWEQKNECNRFVSWGVELG